jgi:hypothetical protein
MENLIYEWSFSDNKNRGKFWYIIAISVVIWLAIWWVITKQYGLTFIVFLISWIVLFIENNSNENIEIKINDLWIKISDNFYDYKKIKNFWFIYSWDDAVILRLNLNSKWITKIDLKINNQICSNLKNILPNFLEEVDNSELTSWEKIINFLKL